MTPDQVFSYRYDQLVEIVESDDLERILDLSATLRQFLVDGERLIDIVNRAYRLQLSFTANESTVSLSSRLAGTSTRLFMWIGDPSGVGKRVVLSKDQFLRHTVLCVQGTHYSVREVIKACANRLGGVHIGDPVGDDPDEAAIRKFNESVWIGDEAAVFRGLRAIGTIVRDGLRPLRDAIKLKES